MTAYLAEPFHRHVDLSELLDQGTAIHQNAIDHLREGAVEGRSLILENPEDFA